MQQNVSKNFCVSFRASSIRKANELQWRENVMLNFSWEICDGELVSLNDFRVEFWGVNGGDCELCQICVA